MFGWNSEIIIRALHCPRLFAYSDLFLRSSRATTLLVNNRIVGSKYLGRLNAKIIYFFDDNNVIDYDGEAIVVPEKRGVSIICTLRE